MNNKYTVVYIVPEEIRHILEETYQRATGTDLPVRRLHISLAFSFFLREGYSEEWLKQQVEQIGFEPISAWLTQVNLFTAQLERPLLYIRVEPFEPLQFLQKQVVARIRDGMEVDLTVFSDRVAPEFVPHISLDYEFGGGDSVLNRLQAEKINAWFEVDRLAVIRMEGEGWEEI